MSHPSHPFQPKILLGNRHATRKGTRGWEMFLNLHLGSLKLCECEAQLFVTDKLDIIITW